MCARILARSFGQAKASPSWYDLIRASLLSAFPSIHGKKQYPDCFPQAFEMRFSRSSCCIRILLGVIERWLLYRGEVDDRNIHGSISPNRSVRFAWRREMRYDTTNGKSSTRTAGTGALRSLQES